MRAESTLDRNGDAGPAKPSGQRWGATGYDTEAGLGLTPGLAGLLLWWVLGCAGLLGGTTAYLSWRYGATVAVHAAGVVAPGQRQRVKAPLSALLRQVDVVQGQRVAAGDTLARLDDQLWQADVEQATQALALSRVRIQTTGAEIDGQLAVLDRERERCELELRHAWLQVERLRAEAAMEESAPQLLRWRRVPFAERVPVRQALLQVRQCSLGLDLATQRLIAARNRRLELRGLLQAQAQLRRDSLRAADLLRQTAIVAPAAGTVLTDRVEARAGDYVQAGAVLVELAPLDSWHADVLVGEQDVARVRRGQEARLFVEAFPHLEYKLFRGRVESVSLEPAAAGQYRARLLIEDPTVLDEGHACALAYGMHAQAQIVVRRGRIIELVWRHLLRWAGRAARPETFAVAAGGDR